MGVAGTTRAVLLLAATAAVGPAQGPDDAASRATSRGVASRATQDPAALRREAAALFRERRCDELLDLLAPRLVDDADAADLWVMAAEASLQLEDYAAAVARFERGMALRPALAAACVHLGLAYVKVDRAADARAFLARFANDPKPERRAKAAYALGLAAAAEGDDAAAAAAFRNARDLAPDDARPRYRLAGADLEAGRADAAIEGFRDVLARDRLHTGAAYGLARALRLAGRAEEADRAERRHAALIETAEKIRRALRVHASSPRPADACFELAALYVAAEDRASAARWLERGLARDPHHAAADGLRKTLAALPEEKP